MATSEKPDHRTHSVLVVEDDPSGRYSITIALEKKNVDVTVAEDGAEALQWLKDHDFCAIVLDLIMPKVDGYGVIRWVIEHAPHIPIIVVTGLKPDELSGVDRRVVVNVMFKPFSASELATQVIDLCENPRTPPAETT
jgi:two-component system response regulator PilR (NtrC family)